MFNNLTLKIIIIINCCSFYCFAEIEHSIIPLIDKYENIENLPLQKFSTRQSAEIQSALKLKEEKIRVATYNVLFNVRDENLSFVNRWPQRLPRLCELLDEMQPDILSVQELFKDQLEDLLPYIGNTYAYFSRVSEDEELNCIFYRKDRFKVLHSKILYMTETPTIPSYEVLTILQLQDLKTKRCVAIFNAHMSLKTANIREFQAHFIAQEMETYSKFMPVVLTGDLNTFAARLDLENLPFYDGDYIHRILTQGKLKNSKEVSILGHLGPISTFTNGPDSSTPFRGTGTPGIFLDHIYVSTGIQVLIHAVQPGKVNGHYPSDHLPVLIDMIIE